MKIKKTSRKDFELFVKECKRWVKIFGLKAWDINYYWQKIEPAEFATCTTTPENVIAEIRFNTKPDFYFDNAFIKRAALHEIIHIVLARLSNLARERYINEKELATEEETVCTLFENILSEKDK